MKKRTIAGIVALATVAATLVGCDRNYGKIDVKGKQDYDYVVTSNGGSAVQYGDYVYFINGYRGYEDDNADANVYGEVVKGGLYRAQLNGKASSEFYNGVEGVKVFDSVENADTHSKLISTAGVNYKNEDVNLASVQKISPKTIGTSGYSDGGLFVYGEYVYYATPVNKKDKQGETMDTYTLFMRSKLDGSHTEEIYTSETETNDSPYAFYQYNGSVYLVLLEEGSESKYVISVNASAKKKTVTKIADKVQSLLLPVNPVYYEGRSENTVYDYIYIKYSAADYYKEDNTSPTGNVLEYMRPDGTEGTNVAELNSTLDWVAVRDGVVFYKDEYQTDTVLKARDYQSLMANTQEEGFNEIVLSGSAVGATQLYPFIAGSGAPNTNSVQVLAATSSELTLYANGGKSSKVLEAASEITIQTTDSGSVYYKVGQALKSYDLTADGSGAPVTLCDVVTASYFKADIVDDYLVFGAKLDEKFDDYAFFYYLAGAEGADNLWFVGERNAKDVRSSIEKIEINEDSMLDVKTVYKTGDGLSVKNLKIDLYYYADKDGKVEKKTVSVKKEWVSGFSADSANSDLELTVTYEDEQDSFTTTYNVVVED